MPQILASKLRGMNVVTDRGLQIGRLSDILIDEKTGNIISLVVKPTFKGVLDNLPKDEKGDSLISYNAVLAIRDLIVVNERILAIHQMKISKPETPEVEEEQQPFPYQPK